MKAIIPTKIGMLMLLTKILEKANTEAIAKDLDMADEFRETAVVHMASYQAKNNKPIQLACKTACISSRRPSLKKGL